MARHRVQLTRSAEKEFAKLPAAVVRSFTDAIDAVAEHPWKGRPGADIRRLGGTKSTWRLRVGNDRGVYAIEGNTVVFTRFAHRSKVYDV